jgi:hypothetical protein
MEDRAKWEKRILRALRKEPKMGREDILMYFDKQHSCNSYYLVSVALSILMGKGKIELSEDHFYSLKQLK